MKTKLIIILAIISNMSVAQIQRDKTYHFGVGTVIGGVTTYFSERAGLTHNKFESVLVSATVTTVVAMGKEAYDTYVKKTFMDGKDILWTALGGIVGSVSVTYTIKPKNRSITPTF